MRACEVQDLGVEAGNQSSHGVGDEKIASFRWADLEPIECRPQL